MAEQRINIDITADDQVNGELAARLIAATFNEHGFEDITNVSHPTHVDRDDEVIAAMRTLSPGIFNNEVVIEVSTFETAPVLAGAGDDDIPGDSFPDPDSGDDDDVPEDD